MRKLFAKAQDRVSCETHAFGAAAALCGALVYVLRGMWTDAAVPAVAAAMCFCLSMVALYAASAIYHYYPGTAASGGVKRMLRKMDHSMIYVLIAGSYTPVCMLTLWEGIGKVLLALVWGIAAAGMILKLFWVYCPKWVSSVLYIGMGWVCILAFPQLWNNLSAAQFGWLLAGGIIYTIGGVIYALKLPLFNMRHKNFGTHEIFHLFVMGGSACHFIVMYAFVL